MLGLVILTPPGRREIVQRVHGRTMTNDEGIKLLRMVRRSSGSVVTWRRTQMVLLSAQGMEPTAIAEVTFTSADRVRDVIHNFSSDGFAYLAPKYGGGRPPKFTLAAAGETRRLYSPRRFSSVHRAALLRPGRHRPQQPHRASQHDPPLRRLADPVRSQPPQASQDHHEGRDHPAGEGCLTRH